jgi:RHS repeat-associated protein
MAGTELAGAVELDLGGKTLLVPAALSLALSPPPAAGDKGLLLEAVDLGAGAAWRPVAALQATANGWTTAALDPADLPWPGVRDEGIYAFVRLTGSFGYLRGTVFDVGGAPLAAAVLHGAPLPWLQLTNADGRYALPAPVGLVAVLAESPTTGNQGSASATVPAADARVGRDVTLAVVGPRVLEITPADGAVDVPQGIQPTIRFSSAVDPSAVAAGLQLLESGSPVAFGVDVQGALVRVTPSSTLLPATAYELRVLTGVRDLRGTPLEAPAAATFTTRRVLVSNDLDLSRVFLVEPDANGDAQVIGRAGAVPAGTLVFVENRSALANTPSVSAGADGSFGLTLQAALTHRLVLHVLIPGSNEVVVELTPFRTADLKGAYVGADAVTFTTGDGVRIEVAAGTFAGPTRVRLEPQPVSAPPAPVPSGLAAVYAFNLDFGGAEAKKALQISVPPPAGAPAAVEGIYLLDRMIVIQGTRYWMMHDLMRLDAATGLLTTDLPPEGSASSGLPAAARVAALGEPFHLAAAQPPGRVLAPKAIVRQYKGYVTGSAFPGQYQVAAAQIPLGFTVFPTFDMSSLVGVWNLGLEGMATAIDKSVEQLLQGDGILMPTRRNESYTIVVRDLSSGFKLYQNTFDPVTSLDLVELPPDVYGDKVPPFPVDGTPVRFLPLNFSGPAEQNPAPGMKAVLANNQITLTGEAGSTQSNVQLHLIGLDDSTDARATSDATGAFTLSASGKAAQRYLLAVGARIPTGQSLDVTFSEALKDGFPGVDVLDAGGAVLTAKKDPVGTRATVRLHLETGWRAGQHYTLRLGPDLADASGNSWQKRLDVQFEIAASEKIGNFDLLAVRDVARLGSWLFVAADTDGLLVLNADDPAHLKNVLPAKLGIPFPLNDAVRGVAVDPHGRVLVAGGGALSPGQLKIFDPLALDVAAITANPDDVNVRLAAYKGSTLISDQLGGPGTQLPSGLPRRVAVLSNDTRNEWKLGDTPPAGITVTQTAPATGPDGSALPDVTVTVQGIDGRAGMPATLKDEALGRWSRVDAEPNGHYTLTLKVRSGDRLQLLRNQDSIAYVATPGVGLEVVDVDAFYNEDHNFVHSDIRGTYSGYQAGLELCGQPVADIGIAFVDLATLFDPENLNPLTVVGLVGERGFVLLRSNPASVGDVSLLNEECTEFEGSTAISGLTVLQKYIFDFNGDGKLDPSEARDYILVAHQKGGVLIYDVTDRLNIKLVGRIQMPGPVSGLSVDTVHRLLYVAGGAAGLYIVDLNALPSLLLIDQNHDGKDDRILETIALTGNTNIDIHLVPGLGLGFGGGANRGLTSVALGHPQVDLIARNQDGKERKIDRLAPFGVPTAKESADPASPDLSGSFYVQAQLPGLATDQVRVDLVSLAAGGTEIDGLGDSETVTGLPRTRLSGDAHGLVLKRLSDKPFEEGYNLYRSDEIAAIADVRAAKAYTRIQKEKDDCTRCDLPDGKPLEILSGERIGVRFPTALRTLLKDIYTADRLDQAETSAASIRWETVPSFKQEPALNPSLGHGDAVPGTLLHSGEMSLQAADLTLKGRGFDFVFNRVYRSQTLGAGPLGPGWDFSYHLRLRELPNGDVEYYDGHGRRELFRQQEDKTLKAPKGVFVTLERIAAGWVLLDPRHNLYRFDGLGRLTSVDDARKESKDTGNEMSFFYDLSSRLIRVSDSVARDTLFEYDDKGRMTRIQDPTGRQVKLDYDEAGRLDAVTSPKIETGTSQFPQGLTTHYTYEAATGNLADLLNHRDNLASITDPLEERWLSLTYSDGDGDGRPDEVASQTWGSGTVQLTYSSGSHSTTVTDREGHPTQYHHDQDGHVTQIVDAASAVTPFEYDDEGLLASTTEPLGRFTTYSYGERDERRSRGNMTLVSVTPGSGGPNGSAGTLVTSITHEALTNQPTRIVDPRGTVTEIERPAFGLPTRITQGAGTASASSTQLTYNDFGQLTQVVNANGHETNYGYFSTDERRAYLQSITEDVGGLGLLTTFEVDLRGNPTRITDPRRLSPHTRTWNEIDQLVEAHEPLGLSFNSSYDAAGNLVEQQVPVHLDQSTSIHTTYGSLGEVLTITKESDPGVSVVEQFTYDKNLNPTQHTAPGGEITRWTYDARNLPYQVITGADSSSPDDPNAVTVTSEYDAEGRLIHSTDGRGALWTTGYDGYGRAQESTDPLGNKTRISYDEAGHPTDQKALDASQKLLSEEQAEFDPLGRITIQREKLWSDSTSTPSQRSLETRLEYDALGHVRRQTDPLGRVTQMGYDGAERLIRWTDPAGNATTLALDAAGNALSTTTVERNQVGGTRSVVESAVYDELNRPKTMTDPMRNTRGLRYDQRGNVVLATDPEGNATAFTYDSLDRLTKTDQPAGISITYGYDASSRLTSYKDALGHETKYAYDALGRRTSTTYPDARTETYSYDKAGNMTFWKDPANNRVTQAFDTAGRLQTRAVVPGTGVIGPLTETYTHDGLGRLTQVQSGSVVTQRSYDSLSRVMSETSGGKTLTYGFDDAGNPLQIKYPSGYTLTQTVDPLDLLQTVSSPSISNPLAVYRWQGMGSPVKKDFANGLSEADAFDPSGRLLSKKVTQSRGVVLDEQLRWTPRDQKAADTRKDHLGATWLYSYDPASRLSAAGRSSTPLALPDNTPVSQGTVAAQPGHVTFTYDPAQNLTKRDVQKSTEPAKTETMPLDTSKVNQPSSVAGIPLDWDLNGNLVRKGSQRFLYDYRNRLTQVLDSSGNPVATYTYDAFNRRISKTVGSEVRAVVWDGWRPVEEYKNDHLVSRRTYGADLDEIVQLENHFDANGENPTSYVPVFDQTGNLAVATNATGKPIETYAYSAYGIDQIKIDSQAPGVNQVLAKGGTAVWIELSESILSDSVAQAAASHLLTLTSPGASQGALVASPARRLKDGDTELAIDVILPVLEEPEPQRRIVITPVGAPPVAGTQVKLTIPSSALQDAFLNEPDQPFELTFAWPAANAVLYGTSATLAVRTAPKTLNKDGDPEQEVGDSLEPPNPRNDTPVTTIDNAFNFQGLPKDPETGFVYMRNRYYDPEIGRFITADPLGYVDGPNGYGFVKNDPVNGGDPFGLFSGTDISDILSAIAIMARHIGGEGAADNSQESIEAGRGVPRIFDRAIVRKTHIQSPEDTENDEQFYRSAGANYTGLIAPIGSISRQAGKSVKHGGLAALHTAEVVQNIQMAGGIVSIARKLGLERAAGESVLMFSQRVEREAAAASADAELAGLGSRDGLPVLPRSVGAAGRITLRSRIKDSAFAIREANGLSEAAQSHRETQTLELVLVLSATNFLSFEDQTQGE